MVLLRLFALVICAVALTSAYTPTSYQDAVQRKWQPETAEEILNFCKLLPKRKLKASQIAEAFHKLSDKGKVVAAKGQKFMKMANDMAKSKDMPENTATLEIFEEEMGPSTLNTMMKAAGDEGEEEIDCDRVRGTVTFDGIEFRSANGECNNLEHPKWGASEAPLLRLSKTDYGGFGFDDPTTVRVGKLLPGARQISVAYHGDQANNDVDHSYYLMQWGQFLDHDVTLSPTVAGAECDNEATQANNPDCLAILIKDDDPQFGVNGPSNGLFRRKIIPFTRSAPTEEHQHDGIFRPREQFNEITAYIDASNVYGSDSARLEVLRDPADAALLLTASDGQNNPFLPFNIDGFANEVCQGEVPVCHFAGDVRASEQTFLAVTHGLWLKEHNRIAAILRRLNTKWSVDRIFYEARRIVASVHQHIVYDEYLPNLLNRKLFRAVFSKYMGYDDTVNAGIFNEFSAAAYRLGHSQLRNQLARLDKDYNTISEIDFRQAFFQPFRIVGDPDGTFDNYQRGLLGRQSQQIDRFVSEELNNHLFEQVGPDNNPTGPGLDLASLNIQRGRDHGLDSYFNIRRGCSALFRRNNIRVPFPFISAENRKRLRNVYGSILAVDLWVGGLSETALEKALPISDQDGGQLGPTFFCILSFQFRALRDGDRFFYKNLLTKPQINAIDDTSLSTYICNNVNDPSIMKVQPQAFRFPLEDGDGRVQRQIDQNNQRVPCAALLEKPRSRCLDLAPWASGYCKDEWSEYFCTLFKLLGACSPSSYLNVHFEIRSKQCRSTCNACTVTSKRADGRICNLSDIK